MENKYWLSDQDYTYVYSKVPRLNVDVIIRKDGGILFTKRSIEPCLHFWHLPGGTVYKGETIKEATIRIAKNETGTDVNFVKSVGYMEFLNEDRDSVMVHTVSIVVEAEYSGGDVVCDKNTEEIRVIKSLDDVGPIIKEHLAFFKEYSILN